MSEKIVEHVKGALRRLGSPKRAARDKRYMKSDLDHYGIKVPELRKLSRQTIQSNDLNPDQALTVARGLWRSGWYEERSLAILLTARFADEYGPETVPEVFEPWLSDIGGWSHLDSLCIEVIGVVAGNHPSLWRRIFDWRLDDHMWTRRASIVSYMQVVRDGTFDRERFRQTCADLASERDFFIRKAIGWLMREYSRKWPEEAVGMIIDLGPVLSPLSLREAIRRYPADKQASIRAAIET